MQQMVVIVHMLLGRETGPQVFEEFILQFVECQPSY